MDNQSPRNPLLAGVIFGIIQGVIWLIVGICFMRIAPGMEKVFRDFGADLPEITKRFIFLSHLLTDYWSLAIPLFVLWAVINIGVVGLLGLSQLTLASFCKWTWCALASLAPLAFAALATLAYSMPMHALVNNLATHK